MSTSTTHLMDSAYAEAHTLPSHALQLQGIAVIQQSTQKPNTRQRGSQKKQRTISVSSSEGAKKPRGRPRVEPEDETAADRRRTQIRLAQRAYRLRKETTISSLKDRNDQLKTVIARMQSAFDEFRRKAQDLGISNFSPDLAQELQAAQSKFLDLAATADSEDPVEPGETARLSPKAEYESPEGSQGTVKRPRLNSEESPAAQSFDGSEPFDQHMTTQAAWEMQVFGPGSPVSSSDTVASNPAYSGAAVETMEFVSSMDSSSRDSPDTNGAQSGSASRADDYGSSPPHRDSLASFHKPQLLTTLPMPYTSADQESTFARRLHRASLEKAVHLIQNHILRPSVFRKKFQLCLPYGGAVQILSKVQDTLMRGTSEPLEWDDHPLKHMGGAGLHYKHSSMLITGSTDEDMHDVTRQEPLGPQLLAHMMNMTDEENTRGKAIDMTGFEGEWLDPQDVEAYLSSRGIMLEASATQAVLTLPGSPRSSLSQSGTLSSRPALPPANQLDFFMFEETSDHLGGLSSPAPGDWVWNLSAGSSAGRPSELAAQKMNPAPRSKQVTIDVNVFVKELVKRGTCLGRTPGYRRRDVDRAISLAITARA